MVMLLGTLLRLIDDAIALADVELDAIQEGAGANQPISNG